MVGEFGPSEYLRVLRRYLNKQQPDAMNKKYWMEGWGAAARLLLLSMSTHPFAQGFLQASIAF